RHVGERRVEAQARDVVDYLDARVERNTRDRRLRRVNRVGAAVVYELYHHVDEFMYAAYLLLLRDDLCAGPRGLAADVYDVRTVVRHSVGVVPRALAREPAAAVAEAVGREVDDAHDERARAELERVARQLPRAVVDAGLGGRVL